MIDATETRRRLRDYVYQHWNTQVVAADCMGCSQGFLNEVLSGKRVAPDWLLREVGIKKRKIWQYEDTHANIEVRK